MIVNNSIKEQINDIFDSQKNKGVNGIGIGFKIVNGQKTNDISIVFCVDEKKKPSDLSKDDILPKKISLNGENIITDVVKQDKAVLLSCYPSNDSNITRLQTFPTIPVALKGGMRIVEFPTGFYQNPPNSGSWFYLLGTLGFFATDNENGKVVGVTNRHVVVNRGLIASERNVIIETADPYNTIEQKPFPLTGTMYYPSGVLQSPQGSIFGTFEQCCPRISRYIPYLDSPVYNEVDGALLIPDPSYIDNNSYQVWQPITETIYPASMPFATTQELDNLLISNPTVYCTGQTNGPIGWGTGDCSIHIQYIHHTVNVQGVLYSDQITMQTPNNLGPMGAGDSGSCVMADINGVRKIIGLNFAGTVDGSGQFTSSIFNRIDRVASLLNISAFTTPINTTLPTPSLKSMDLTTYGSSTTIQSGGKTYYQVGLTNNTYP